MYQANRNEMRQAFVDAYQKWRDQEPLEPLEHAIASVVAIHPEYHLLLEDQDTSLGSEFTPEKGQSNPFLHMSLHLALREQVATDRPLGITAAYNRAMSKSGNVHDTEHRFIDVLAESLWEAQRSGTLPDESAYLEKIRAAI